MKSLDKFILNIHQSIANWFNNWFGGDNFFLSKTFLIINILCILIRSGIDLNDPANLGAVIMNFGLCAIPPLVFFPMVLYGERSCKNNARFKNPCEVTLSFIRILQIILTSILTFAFVYAFIAERYFGLSIKINVPSFVPVIHSEKLSDLQRSARELLIFIEMWALFMFLYFGSCTPRPPEQGKLAKLLERLAPQHSI